MLLGQTNAFIDRLYRLFEELTGSLLLGDDLLPVPLIDIDGMDIIGILITANRVHICIETFSNGETISTECHSLPLCKGMYDFQGAVILFLNAEGYGTLYTI